MKILYENEPFRVEKPIKDIKAGTVFSGTINNVKDVYLKTDSAIVSLANAHSALVKLHPNNSRGDWYTPHSSLYACSVATIDDCKELNADLIVSEKGGVMKIKHEDKQAKQDIDIEVGTVFKGQVCCVEGVFLRVLDNIVCLEEPYSVWHVNYKQPRMAQNYEELNARLIVSEKGES